MDIHKLHGTGVTLLRFLILLCLLVILPPSRTSLEVNSMAGDRKGRRGSKAAGSLGASFIRAGAGSEEKDVKRRRSFKVCMGRGERRVVLNFLLIHPVIKALGNTICVQQNTTASNTIIS